MAREVHGLDFDPATQPIDGAVVMRMGGGKQHGRYAIANSSINRSTTPTLSQLRAQSTDSSPAIRPRATATEIQMEQLQARLEADFNARQAAQEARWQEERDRMQQEYQRRLDQAMQYVQSMGAAMGFSPPPFPTPPPTHRAATPASGQSAASNDVPVNRDASPQAVQYPPYPWMPHVYGPYPPPPPPTAE
ncbi:unnamed protein product [Urochloa humidicola]